jgi:hypothetical protein
MLQKKLLALRSCFETLSNVLGLQVIELRIQSGEDFTLVQRFLGDEARIALGDAVENYQASLVDSASPTNLCRESLRSKNGFHWISVQDSSLHREILISTAVGFHLPREQIAIDAFIVAYSSSCIKVRGQK